MMIPEQPLLSLTLYKDTGRKDIRNNLAVNTILGILAFGLGGRMAQKCILKVYDEKLVLETWNVSNWGGLPDLTGEQVFPFSMIQEIQSHTTSQKDDSCYRKNLPYPETEFICLTLKKGKIYYFYRNNVNKDSLGLALSSLLQDSLVK